MCIVVASSTVGSDQVSARKLGHASLGMSIAGIVVSVIVIIIIVVWVRTSGCLYSYNGVCYRHYKYVGDYDYCSGVRSNGYCYYN